MFEDSTAELLAASVSLVELGRRPVALGATESAAMQSIGDYETALDQVVVIDSALSKTAFLLGCHTSRGLPLTDALIAAAAAEAGAVLVHRDEHMRAIPPNLVEQLDLAA